MTVGFSLQSPADLVNLMLVGKLDSAINPILYGGQLIALSKTNGGVRPVVVGYVLIRLAANCANSHVIEGRSNIFNQEKSELELQGSEGNSTCYTSIYQSTSIRLRVHQAGFCKCYDRAYYSTQ